MPQTFLTIHQNILKNTKQKGYVQYDKTKIFNKITLNTLSENNFVFLLYSTSYEKVYVCMECRKILTQPRWEWLFIERLFGSAK